MDISVVNEAVGSIVGDFGSPQPIWEASFGFDAAGSSTSNSKVIGTRLDSTSGGHIVQYRCNGFTYSKTAPYSSWEEISQIARSYWDNYANTVGQKRVTRLAVRYINAISIPSSANLEDYFVAPPSPPKNSSLVLSSFFHRVIAEDTSGTGATAAIAMAHEVNNVIFFDIDVFKPIQASMDAKEIWRSLGAIKAVENRIFFESLTEMGLELFS